MMKKRKTIISVLALCMLFTFVVVIVKNREPSYNGKKLSAWLYQLSSYNPENSVWDGVPENSEVPEAVFAIGADGFPQMIDWFRREDSKLKMVIADFLGDTVLVSESVFKPEEYYWDLANIQLEVLGTNAVPVIDELYELFNNPETHFRIYGTFYHLGPRGVPYLLSAARNNDQTVRQGALMELYDLGSAAKDALPELLQIAENYPEMSTRVVALFSIAGIAEEPEIVLPVLRKLVDDPERRIRQNAVWAFGAFRGEASDYVPFLFSKISDTNLTRRVVFSLSQIGSNSIPVLTQISTDPNPEIRISARVALNIITNLSVLSSREPKEIKYLTLLSEFNGLVDDELAKEGL